MDGNERERYDSIGRTYEIRSKFTKQGNKAQAPRPSEIQKIIKEITKDVSKKEGE